MGFNLAFKGLIPGVRYKYTFSDNDGRGEYKGISNGTALRVNVLRSQHQPINELCERSITIYTYLQFFIKQVNSVFYLNINPLAPELFFLISAHSVYKM